MAAFRGAVNVGSHAIETDIHLSKDGIAVLSHVCRKATATITVKANDSTLGCGPQALLRQEGEDYRLQLGLSQHTTNNERAVRKDASTQRSS